METSWPHKAVFALESATTAGCLYSLYFRALKGKVWLRHSERNVEDMVGKSMLRNV